jgi:hypothetical protein
MDLSTHQPQKGWWNTLTRLACLQAVQIPVCYLAPIVALCMRPVGTSDSILRGQIEGKSPLLQQMQKVLMHLTYRGY